MLELTNVKKQSKVLKPKPLRVYRNPIALAQDWQRTLGKGDCSSPADLARKLGVSRTRMTQVLRLLRLTPQVLKILDALGDPLSTPIVTERKLRPIVNLPLEEQRRKIHVILQNDHNQNS